MVTYGNHAMVQEGILDLRVESACPLDDPGWFIYVYLNWLPQLVRAAPFLFLPGDALAEPFWFLEAFVANLSHF